MADRYVYSGTPGTGVKWEGTTVSSPPCYTTLGAALAAAGADDNIYVADDHQENWAAENWLGFTEGMRIICLSRADDSLSVMNGTTGYFNGSGGSGGNLSFQGSVSAYLYGLYFKNTTGNSGFLQISNGDESDYIFEKCRFGNDGGGSWGVRIGSISDRSRLGRIKWVDCDLHLTAAGQSILVSCASFEWIGGSFTHSTQPTTLFTNNDFPGAEVEVRGVDLSTYTGTLVALDNNLKAYKFVDCAIDANATRVSRITTAGRVQGSVYLINCMNSLGTPDTGMFEHWDALGSTVTDTAIRASDSDAAKYNGTTGYSWVVSTTTAASTENPYCSPWFGVYHSATSAITPGVEILRNKDATPEADAFTNDQVWIEVSVQESGTTTQSTITSGRMAPQGSSSAWGAGIGLANWAGESSGFARSQKLTTSARTPASIGYLQARVCVGLADVTDLYVDPTFRYA